MDDDDRGDVVPFGRSTVRPNQSIMRCCDWGGGGSKSVLSRH